MRRLRAFFALCLLLPGLAFGQSMVYRFPGQIQSADGTVLLPQYSWSSDPNSGMYRIGADNIGIAVNGVKAVDVKTTGADVVGLLTSSNGLTVSGAVGTFNAGATVSASGLSVAGNINSFTGGVRSILDNNSGELRLVAGVSTGGSSTLKSYVHNAGTAVEWLGVSSAGLATFSAGTTVSSGNLTVTSGSHKILLGRNLDNALTGSIYSPTASTFRFSGDGSSAGILQFEPSSTSGVTIELTSTAIALNKTVTAVSPMFVRASDGSKGALTASSSVFYVDGMGQDNATNGALAFRGYRADSTNIIAFGGISATGVWSVGPANASISHIVNGVGLSFYSSSSSAKVLNFFETGTNPVELVNRGTGGMNFYSNNANSGSTGGFTFYVKGGTIGQEISYTGNVANNYYTQLGAAVTGTGGSTPAFAVKKVTHSLDGTSPDVEAHGLNKARIKSVIGNCDPGAGLSKYDTNGFGDLGGSITWNDTNIIIAYDTGLFGSGDVCEFYVFYEAS